MLPEKFLHYVWQNKLFYPIGMKTTDGECIEVINPGCINTDAGPDFFNAQIRIGNTNWAGNIEIHTTTDGWYEHGHNHDAAYDNVILHVVGVTTSKDVVTSKNRKIPEVVLKYPQYIAERYEQIQQTTLPIRCGEFLSHIDQLTRDSWLDRLLFERFEQRNERVEKLITDFNGDIDQVFFCLLARSMGFVVNSEPMEHLARITPVKILIKHNDITQMEALLMGQAGLLSIDDCDEYTKCLKREYEFLKAKFELQPMDSSVWKHLRLRPQNFPAIRLSQLAAIISQIPGNFCSVFHTLDVASIIKKLDVTASPYWDTHYQLGKESNTTRTKRLGLQSRRLLVINAVIPFIFACARRYGDEHEQMNVIRLMQFLPIEHNSYLDKWKSIGIEPQNEGEAQALLLLYKNYCKPKRCLLCRFGHETLRVNKL